MPFARAEIGRVKRIEKGPLVTEKKNTTRTIVSNGQQLKFTVLILVELWDVQSAIQNVGTLEFAYKFPCSDASEWDFSLLDF